MLADAAPTAVLTTAELVERVADSGVPVIDLDDPDIAAQPGSALPAPCPDDIAYLIYTRAPPGPRRWRSPTTTLTHLMPSRPLGWRACRCGPRHSYGFDFSVWEIFAALLHEGPAAGGARGGGRLPDDFHHLLLAEDVTVLTQTNPSARRCCRPRVWSPWRC